MYQLLLLPNLSTATCSSRCPMMAHLQCLLAIFLQWAKKKNQFLEPPQTSPLPQLRDMAPSAQSCQGTSVLSLPFSINLSCAFPSTVRPKELPPPSRFRWICALNFSHLSLRPSQKRGLSQNPSFSNLNTWFIEPILAVLLVE